MIISSLGVMPHSNKKEKYIKTQKASIHNTETVQEKKNGLQARARLSLDWLERRTVENFHMRGFARRGYPQIPGSNPGVGTFFPSVSAMFSFSVVLIRITISLLTKIQRTES